MKYSYRNILRKRIIIILILLCYNYCPATAQQASFNSSIDSLIINLPAMMRSNDSIATQMIAALEQQSLDQQHRHGIIQSIFFKAWRSYRNNPADITIKSIDSALNHIDDIHTDTALVKFYILKGQCFVKKTAFGKALENFKKALNIAKERNDETSQTNTLISIGWAYMEDGKPTHAIHFFNEVLKLNPLENYEHRAVLLCNIASCYNTLGEFKLAETFAEKGIIAARNKKSSIDLANGLNILARSNYQQGKIEKAISILKEAAIEREKISDPSMLASDYLELADLYMMNDQPGEAILWAKKAEAISSEIDNQLKLSAAFKSLSSAYEATGDYKNASAYLRKLLIQKDSSSNEHYNQAFAQMQVQYETQKKTAENLQLKKDNLETKLRNNTQQKWLVALVSGLILLIASGVYISKLMKSRYNTRFALAQLKEQKKRTMAVIEAEEKERRRIAGDLHDGVGQTLAAASMQLNKARNDNHSFDKVDELINQAGMEVRNLSHQVTPELLLHYGLVKALEQAIDRLNDANEKTVFTLFTHIEEPLTNEMVSLTMYRCFQELCTNILKHAHASQVIVQLNFNQDDVELMIEDNGIGFLPHEAVYGLGIKNLEHRIALYDGEMKIDSMPGKGTTIILKIQRSVLTNTFFKAI